MRKIQHDAVVSEWKEIITACRESGLPVSQWCRSNNVKESRYYYWPRLMYLRGRFLCTFGGQFQWIILLNV